MNPLALPFLLASSPQLPPNPSSPSSMTNQANACLGWSVASAGDVNGDGLPQGHRRRDALDGGEIDEGRAIVLR